MNVLLVVDIQNDFLPGRGLAVPDGDAVIPIVNGLMQHFETVLATQDWHPPDHRSFAAQHPGHQVGDMVELRGLQQILWPVHCVQESAGAAFATDLASGRFEQVFRKGTDPSIDSYSGFYDNGHLQQTGLTDYLRARGAKTLYLCGLATDYCVKFTALDAVAEGFETYVVTDGCRGVELHPGDVAAALADMRKAGVRITDSKRWLS